MQTKHRSVCDREHSCPLNHHRIGFHVILAIDLTKHFNSTKSELEYIYIEHQANVLLFPSRAVDYYLCTKNPFSTPIKTKYQCALNKSFLCSPHICVIKMQKKNITHNMTIIQIKMCGKRNRDRHFEEARHFVVERGELVSGAKKWHTHIKAE